MSEKRASRPPFWLFVLKRAALVFLGIPLALLTLPIWGPIMLLVKGIDDLRWEYENTKWEQKP